MTDFIAQGAALPAPLLERLMAATGASRAEFQETRRITRLTDATRATAFASLIPLLEKERINWGFVPKARAALANYRLIAFDMDSTLITIECIDELADFAGKKEEVAKITEAAMRGEMEYPESLRRRLKTLSGLNAQALAQVYSDRLAFSPGARELIRACQQSGLRAALLSGGFTYFTERLRIELGLDFATSNELEIKGGKLTGSIIGSIIDADAKAERLRRLRQELGAAREEVIAVGDGVNDLGMMMEAGLSVAYHAKAAVRARADIALNTLGLDGLLLFLA
ncbi:MAG: phosphoserine phosphatase SerB [Zoogloeaceae bacterium]|jgi:phosphoserine phosphatase|nr:phosphoserine phosphatase SerB [Zoogloeaceae bacterium]